MKGIAFEKAVAALQKRLAPDAEVLHNARLVDRLGHSRQFDVVIRGTIGSHKILGVIECKDWKRRVGPSTVEAFITKIRDLNASLALIVAKRGFTTGALEKARHHGIGTLSLLPDDPNDSGFWVGLRAYGDLYRWTTPRISLRFVAKCPPVFFVDRLDLRWRGYRVVDWILVYLATEGPRADNTGILKLSVQFQRRRKMHVGDCAFFITGFDVQVCRERVRKTKMLAVRGEGLVKWQEESIAIPPGGLVEIERFRVDISDWDDFDGDIDLPKGSLDFYYRANVVPLPEGEARLPEPLTVHAEWAPDDGEGATSADP